MQIGYKTNNASDLFAGCRFFWSFFRCGGGKFESREIRPQQEQPVLFDFGLYEELEGFVASRQVYLHGFELPAPGTP